MIKLFSVVGALLAFGAVIAGSFGAHLLRKKFGEDLLATFEVGVRYQMYHALALFVVAWAIGAFSSSLIPVAGWLFIVGTVIFSGSLYLLAFTGVKTWGAVTPIGGSLFLLGWLCLGVGILRS